MALNQKQKRFVEEYLIDFNATDAAIRAGYKVKSAGAQGSKLKNTPEVAQAIARGQHNISVRAEVRQDEVLQGFIDIAYSDIGNVFYPDGSMKPIHEIPAHTRLAISSIEVFEEYAGSGESRQLVGFTKKVRMWDKLRALEGLARNLGLFNADTSKQPQVNILAMLLQRIDGRGLPKIASE